MFLWDNTDDLAVMRRLRVGAAATLVPQRSVAATAKDTKRNPNIAVKKLRWIMIKKFRVK
jgi:hypothetical protein